MTFGATGTVTHFIDQIPAAKSPLIPIFGHDFEAIEPAQHTTPLTTADLCRAFSVSKCGYTSRLPSMIRPARTGAHNLLTTEKTDSGCHSLSYPDLNTRSKGTQCPGQRILQCVKGFPQSTAIVRNRPQSTAIVRNRPQSTEQIRTAASNNEPSQRAKNWSDYQIGNRSSTERQHTSPRCLRAAFVYTGSECHAVHH
ncbi:Uncharacterised protein [Mycobacteroides abscessus]|uniref:Uncharacterized protein n=1 Tax=Mycobacteroides abscessus subsp. abscessus TaxID=1185650 RepID=A0AB38D4M3_9MYCO|nr:hypothetical protein [Mycobacteroides abscessus]QSM03220.1 hypothetical protein PROPHIGD102-2_14 [Mycobacterium phage prophi102-2]QSM03988.1 hypothetical protein PROPHIGD54-1_14 [Mycobacterium phage prophiGD54-1]SHP25302.1 Uncharacterised protein [Mycobacteroides abscessus subsp. abscessus]MBE5455118.1 hypothetical protein [Mycobacteroides abscessus]